MSKKTIEMYCAACGKYVIWRQGIVKKADGNKCNVYIHKTKNHELIEDKELTDILISKG